MKNVHDFTTISPYLQLKPSNRAKRISLRVDPLANCVYLILPKRASLSSAYIFAQSYQGWIKEKSQKFRDRIKFQDGMTLPIFGQSYIIKWTETETQRSKIYFKELQIRIESATFPPERAIRRFLIKHAYAVMQDMVNKKVELIFSFLRCLKSSEFEYLGPSKSDITSLLFKAVNNDADFRQLPPIKIKDMKSRWGSCATNGQINLSWRLIFAPTVAIDYVIGHEVAHLVHHNHSDRFWSLCEKICADFKMGSKWMKYQGATLMAYGEV